MTSDAPVISRMHSQLQEWEEAHDHREVFLRCYMMMTQNMLAAIQRQECRDPVWVSRLLDHFADYYFVALRAYDENAESAPSVWQLAHRATRDPSVSALQNLLLGVNAHINYDLVLAVVDLLKPEWVSLSASQRSGRYADYCHVNDIIGRTIDAVQDQILDPAMPIMGIFDRLLGSVDELMISHLLTRWREVVWRQAIRLLETEDGREHARLVSETEQEALAIAEFICPQAAQPRPGPLAE